jgi:hypothetical protein
MIDTIVAVGVFTALGLCIVGFDARADKRAGYASRRSRERT